MRLRLLIIFILLSVLTKSQIQTGSFSGLGGACAGWTVYPPSCAPGCDAKMVISFPQPSCYVGSGIVVQLPYNISVNPTGTCAAPAVPTVTFNPGTFTISINACACLSAYFLILTDQGSPLFNTANLPVTAPSIQRLGVTTRSVDCASQCTGTLGATYFNTTGPYNFTVTTPGGGSTVSSSGGPFTAMGLCIGVNTVDIVDNIQGCTRTDTYSILGPPPFNWAGVTTSVACFGFCTGVAAVTPTGGTANYTVTWNPGATTSVIASGQTSSIGGLCAGVTRTASVVDSKGCIYPAFTTSINGPPQLTVTPTQTNVFCPGGSNGTASVTVSGGVAPYGFTWSPSGITGTNAIGSLTVGTNTVLISNNGGQCTTTAAFNITGPNVWTITPTIRHVACATAPNTGTVGLAVNPLSGNGGPFQFTWTPVSTTVVAGNTLNVTNLTAQSYSYIVKDATGCTTVGVITVTAPPAYTVSAASQSIQCFSVCTGAATVNISGASPAYTVTWAPGGQTTTTLSGLCQGSYTANIVDSKGCTASTIVTITQPASVTPNINTTSITCNGLCNGVITSTPSNGNAPYTFTLVTPLGASLTSGPALSASFPSLCVGIHTLYITGASGCTQSLTSNVTQPNPLNAGIATTSVTCFNVCNATASGTVGGGSAPYTFTWTTPTGTATGAALAGQCAGNFTMTVTDGNGCKQTVTTTIAQPPQITATITPTNILCNGGPCTGILNAGVGGGTPGYNLSWSNGFVGNPNTNLCAGNYTLTVTDNASCSRTFAAAIVAPSAFTITINTSSPTCAGMCTGAATITPSGGTPGYTIQCNIPPLVSNTTGILTGICPGPHVANVTDANGCSTPVNFNINNPPILSVGPTSVVNSCNVCTGAATVFASGGTPTYNIVWTSTAGVVGNGVSLSNLCTGAYTVTVFDAAGCTATCGINILQTVNVSINLAGGGIICNNACTGTAVATPTGGTGPYGYTWTPSGITGTNTANNICSGMHTVQVTDVNGCFNTATINIANPPAMTVQVTQTNNICFGDCLGALSASVTGGTAPITFTWNPGGINTPSIGNLCNGGHTLQVKDANNCTLTPLNFSITSNPLLTATVVTTNPTGCLSNNGSLCANPVVGGNGGPYTFTWFPSGGNGSCATNLGAGAYSLIVSDGLCTNTIAALLTNPTGPTLTINTSPILCFGAATGGATITASGGGPYSFTWSPGTPSVVAGAVTSANGLLSGTYNISCENLVTNCITSQTFAITQAASLNVVSSFTNPLCNLSNNGTITLVTSGGTPTYNFVWAPAPGGGQGTQTVTGLGNNVYNVTITDANGCVNTRTFNVVAPPAITLSTTFTNVLCFNACNGQAAATATGGTAPINFNWLPLGGFSGSITAAVGNMCPGIYTVIATDGNTCSAQATVQITQPTQLTSTLNFVNATCSNSCNISASVTAGNGSPGYTYSWTAGPSTLSTISGLCPGTVSVTVTDSKGCFTTTAFTPTAPPAFTPALVPTNPNCNSACTGSITTTLSGNQGTVSFVWAPSGSGQNPTGLCPGSYTLTAIDAASCQAIAVATLANPPSVLANITQTNASCSGTCNGAAAANPTNVTAPVQYTWLPGGQTTSVITNQCPGVYTLNILDALNCTVQAMVTLTTPSAATINPAATPASCGFNNGSITIVVAGGTPTFNISWLPLGIPNGSVANNLGAGVYTVTIVDVNNCTNTVMVPLGNSNGPSVTPVAGTSLTCFNICNGSATVDVPNIQGGTPGYNVTWLAPAGPANPATNLCAGTYTAQITDSGSPANCITFTTIVIAQPASITVNPSFTIPTCPGINDGVVVLNTSGGTPGYTYSWTPLGPNNSATLTNAAAATYTIFITDNVPCPSTSVVVTVPAAQNMNALFVLNQNPCFGNCVGAATITPSGGAVAMNVSWSNGQFGNVANGLCNGTYTALVTDGNGCFNTFTTDITSPIQITATTSIAAPGCSLCNGGATVNPSGGLGGPYQFNWTTGATTQTVNNLCAGLYQVLITDANSCTITQNVMVSSANGITGQTFSLQNVSCAGVCNGGATVTPIGGTPAYTYSWIAPPSNVSSISGVCSGTYFVQMIDAQQCTRVASVAITAANPLTVAPFVQPPTCGIANGTIALVPSGGTPTYAIAWAPPLVGSSTVQTGLNAGVYSATITDNAGCAMTQSFNLSNSTAPTITGTITNLRCFNVCTGSVVIATAGSTATPFTYAWSSGGSTTTTATNLCSGLITVTVTANDGCKSFQTFSLSQNPQLQLSISNAVQPLCHDDCNGQITLIPSGGTLPYTFSWSPNGATSNPNASICAIPGPTVVYTGTVTDNFGCTTSETLALINPSSITAVSSFTNSSCSTIPDGSASINASGGTPTLSIVWTAPNSTTVSGASLNGVLAGTYTVTVVDSKSCTQINTVTIVPTITIDARAGLDQSFCTGTTAILDGTASIGAASYLWFLAPLPSPSIANTGTTLVAPATGTSMYILIATSSVAACFDQDTMIVNSIPLPVIDAGPSYTIPVFSTQQIGGSPTFNGNGTYTWTPAFTLDNGNIPNPVANNTVNTNYTLTVMDASTGCVASATVEVDLFPQIIIPNGFSPNGDARNDKWVIDNIFQFDENVVEVYNRWGELLFYKKQYNGDFDGKYNGKDLPVGTYYYVINLNHPAYPKAFTGPLTIFR
jgi:gliding motility-associated-like protein